ncbi:MAG: TonB-dependent siderophore receptor [Methylobacillus sp.]|jgi:catecholate siderophore receptor|nr:TonB-dependent siderophore receptor [Methylobacillus sp.]
MKSKSMTVPLLPLGAALMAGGFSLNTMAAETDVVLPTVKVDVNVDTEQGYRADKTRVGKTEQDPHDIPQAVTTVTDGLMRDQQVDSLKDALRNVSGLTFNAAEGGRSGDNMLLRGFYTFGDTYLDGMRDTAQYNRETFNLEQVDVLRGSAAMLFGRGQAGGVINQVSKMAELENENVISASLGEWNYRQFTGDFKRQLTDTAALRVNVMSRYEESYRKNPSNDDHPELDRQGIAVSFGAGIGTANELFLNYVRTETRDVPDYGVSFFNGRPIDRDVAGGNIDDSVFYGGNKNFDDSVTRMGTLIFTHKFSEDTQWRAQLRHGNYERSYWAKTPNENNLPRADYISVPPGNQTRMSDYRTTELQNDFNTSFDFAGMKHQFLVGAEYLREDSSRRQLQQFTNASGIYFKPYVGTGDYTTYEADNYAAYVQDTIEFIPQWDLTLGVRRDELRADYSNPTSPKFKLNYGENSYRAGLSWHPSDAAHYYVSWSDAFSPTGDLYQLTVAPLPPETSKTAEMGAKYLFFGGDLAFRVALYRTTKYWERNADLESTTTILTRERRTDGLEFEVAGRVTNNWEVFAGLALMDAEIIRGAANVDATTGVMTYADPAVEGKRPSNTPSYTFNVWTTYKFLGNWRVGGGVNAVGERYAYNASTTALNWPPNKAPGYARVDAMLAYEGAQWAVRLNVKNVLDKEYYDAIYLNGAFSVPGNRRQAILTTEYKF